VTFHVPGTSGKARSPVIALVYPTPKISRKYKHGLMVDAGRVFTWTPLEQPRNPYDATISVARAVVHVASLNSVSCSALAGTVGATIALSIVLDCVTAL